MQKTITVIDVVLVKNGVGPRGPWQLFNVVDEQGAKYSTFKEDYLAAKGKTITIEFEKKGNYLNIIEPKNLKAAQAQTTGGNQALNQLIEKLFEKLDRIEKKIDGLTTE